MPRRSSRANPASRGARTPAVGALDAGLRLLARRAHSRIELGRKLSRRGYQGDEVEAALARLRELGYLDDRAFAEGHVRRRGQGLGPRALSAELAARGVDRRIADRAVAGFGEDAQVAAATRLAERLCAAGRPTSLRQLLDTVGPKLLRRGFAPSIARTACQAVLSGTPSDIED